MLGSCGVRVIKEAWHKIHGDKMERVSLRLRSWCEEGWIPLKRLDGDTWKMDEWKMITHKWRRYMKIIFHMMV